VLGPRLVEARLHPSSIQLTGVRGTFQKVKGDRSVFVIAGTAINASALPTRPIQVEGRAIGASEERQVVYCGVAPRDLHDLTMREIALLQNLEPPRDWSLGPGEQTDFVVVFTAPPPDLRQFAVEVGVGAGAPARRPDPHRTCWRIRQQADGARRRARASLRLLSRAQSPACRRSPVAPSPS
jgi:hypothetical protein